MPKAKIRILFPIQSKALKAYLEARCIPMKIAYNYLSEAIFFSDKLGHNIHCILFLSNNMGLIYKSAWNVTGSRNVGITTITLKGLRCTQPTHEVLLVFSGFMDFLSYLVIKGLEKPDCDVLILNGCSNVEKGMRFMRQHLYVFCYLGIDPRGRNCQKFIDDNLKGCLIVDRSDMYDGDVDLNAHLVRMKDKETAPEIPRRRNKSKSEKADK